jgi:hypothetical protein
VYYANIENTFSPACRKILRQQAPDLPGPKGMKVEYTINRHFNGIYTFQLLTLLVNN